jgi:hypothetical protein
MEDSLEISAVRRTASSKMAIAAAFLGKTPCYISVSADFGT